MVRKVLLVSLLVVWSLVGAASGGHAQSAGDLEDRVSRLETQVRDSAETGMVLFLFGAFCALWAQNRGRSAWAWFFGGALFSVAAVVLLLIINGREARERVQGVG